MLEQANANIVIIDRITGIFNATVSPGEPDMIDDAMALFDNFKNNFEQLNKLGQAHATDIQQIKSLADDYIHAAKSLSIGMLEGTLEQENIASSVAAMNHSLDALKTHLINFKDESYASFTQTIAESDEESQRTLTLGIIIVASLLFTWL